MSRKTLSRAVTVLLTSMIAASAYSADPAAWVTNIDASTYLGSTGTITFNDWGYKGPTGVGATDFQIGTGFDPSRIGQIQHVVTKAPDWLGPDDGMPNAQLTVYGDMGNPSVFTNPNMDGNVNFYQWGYTTPANSTFSNMQIDKAGNYHIAKSDMSFGFYDEFQYRDTTGVNPGVNFDTRINFQPYAVSDARGWCGSTLVPDPNAVASMAGQVTFDVAFDVYLADLTPAAGGAVTQLIPSFVMRSYGDYVVDVSTSGGIRQYFLGSAVGNNTSPDSIVLGVGGTLDAAYQNQVSFLGAGVIPAGVWVSADSFNADGSRKMRTDYNPTTGITNSVWDVTIVEAGTPGATWHTNAFAGFAFILRADGTRTLDFVSPTGHSDYVTPPCLCWTDSELAGITNSGGSLSCGSTATSAVIRNSSPIQLASADTSLATCRFTDTGVSPRISRRVTGLDPAAAQSCYNQVVQACASSSP